MIEINYWAVLLCGVLAMVVGAIWYGPLFGSVWMRVVGVKQMDSAARKKMQKEAGPLYIIQFLLVLFQLYVLAHYIAGWKEASGLTNALWIWTGFVMPTIAASCLWNNDSRSIAWSRFLVQAGYQLVLFILFGLILGYWL
jgi:Protein of unknown function (DUF1761)